MSDILLSYLKDTEAYRKTNWCLVSGGKTILGPYDTQKELMDAFADLARRLEKTVAEETDSPNIKE